MEETCEYIKKKKFAECFSKDIHTLDSMLVYHNFHEKIPGLCELGIKCVIMLCTYREV